MWALTHVEVIDTNTITILITYFLIWFKFLFFDTSDVKRGIKPWVQKPHTMVKTLSIFSSSCEGSLPDSSTVLWLTQNRSLRPVVIRSLWPLSFFFLNSHPAKIRSWRVDQFYTPVETRCDEETRLPGSKCSPGWLQSFSLLRFGLGTPPHIPSPHVPPPLAILSPTRSLFTLLANPACSFYCFQPRTWSLCYPLLLHIHPVYETLLVCNGSEIQICIIGSKCSIPNLNWYFLEMNRKSPFR